DLELVHGRLAAVAGADHLRAGDDRAAGHAAFARRVLLADVREAGPLVAEAPASISTSRRVRLSAASEMSHTMLSRTAAASPERSAARILRCPSLASRR